VKRLEKESLVSDLSKVFSDNSAVVVVHYKGLTVAQLNDVRTNARKNEIGFEVVKNSLASIALKETQSLPLADLLKGPTAIAWGNDPVSLAKVLADLGKKSDKLVIQGGVFNGSALSAADVNALSTLPSFDELRGKLVGLLTAAATKVAVISRTPATNVVGALSSYAKKAS